MSENPGSSKREIAGSIATQTPEEREVPSDSQQGTPRAEKSIFRRIANSRAARPVAVLLGLGVATTGVGLAVNSGGSEVESTKAPDAIVKPVPKSLEPQSPQQTAAKVLENHSNHTQEHTKLEQAKFTEDEKKAKITEVLEAVYPDLLPFLENGQLPYYDENNEWGSKFRVVSFVPEDAMPPETGFSNRTLAVAPNEHWFDIAMSGIDMENFPRKEPGSKEPDMEISRRIQSEVKGIKDRWVVIVPKQINGQDVPWPWLVEPHKEQDPMFTAHTDYPFEGDKGRVRLRFDPDQVKNSAPSVAHHADARIQVNGAPGIGAN